MDSESRASYRAEEQREEEDRVLRKCGLAGWDELLQELMNATAPYLRRKKMTPRHECKELNRVWAKCDAKLNPNS
jgi:hypothetical protein